MSTSGPSPPKPDPIVPPPNPIDAAVQQFLDDHSFIKDINYDFRPMIRALAEPLVDISTSLPNFNKQVLPRASQVKSSHVTKVTVPPGSLPTKDPKLGSWDFVRYCPSWMDPAYNEDLEVKGNSAYHNTVRDSFYNLRPAMRFEDTVRNPTPFARRFGIAADRTDGRSRMSPTWSNTRDPFIDFENQVNMLTDAQKQEATELTARIYATEGRVPAAGRTILEDIMQELLRRHGLLTNAELIDSLHAAAQRGWNLDQMIAELGQSSQNVRVAHQLFLESVQQDQEYQRVIANDLTTDDMMMNDVLTLSDDVTIDLDNQLHHLLRMNSWESSDWKGSQPQFPKYVYNVNGVREQWDPNVNPKLWTALQPALRLVTKVLESEHPIFESILDLNTRQPIPPYRDIRNNSHTPNLVEYVPKDHIDMDNDAKTFRALQKLHQDHNYDWKSETLRVLDDHLVFDIRSGYIGVDDASLDSIEEMDFCYGMTNTVDDGHALQIKINIAAEIIWPLLSDTFSQSEKLVSSFMIANVILHELGHAMNHAQMALSMMEEVIPDGQAQEVTDLLYSLANELWDPDAKDVEGEHFAPGTLQAEMGNDVEQGLWGFTINTLFEAYIAPRHLESLPIALSTLPWPTPNEKSSALASSMAIVESHSHALPISWMARFFTKKFWDEDVVVYGYKAFRQLPNTRIRTNMRMGTNTWHTAGDDVFGEDNMWWFKAVRDILFECRQDVLAHYLQALVAETTGISLFQTRWARLIKNWHINAINPLEQEENRLRDLLIESQNLHASRYCTEDHQQIWYEWYLRDGNSPIRFDAWQNLVTQRWRDMFRHGGRIMQQLSEVYRLVQRELGFLERMIFDFLTVDHNGRARLYTGMGEHDRSPIGAAYARITSFEQRLGVRIVTLNNMIRQMPQLDSVKDHYAQWRAKLQSCQNQYKDLLAIIGERDNLEPNDISWKPRFPRVPSSYWRPTSQRLEKLAQREFNRLDPAVRVVVQEFVEIVNANRTNAVALPDIGTIDDITDLLNDIPNYDAASKTVTGGGGLSMFQLTFDPNAITQQALQNAGVSIPAVPVPVPAPVPVAVPVPVIVPVAVPIPAPATTADIVFGAASMRRFGVDPPRRAPGADSSGTAVFTTYTTNPFSTPVTTAQQQANIFAAVPGAVPGWSAPAPFGVIPVNQTRPFPNPWADRTMLTSEIQTFEAQRQIQSQVNGMANQASGTYTTPGMWRDRRGSNSPP
ncbi:hypothetical protein F5Y16DRAFT_400585 [Xylariaceae sp. FL0255]|nr:hypothetical protein F5Y16DRAFT_400585 [Xylariaceae sp. FL0255]